MSTTAERSTRPTGRPTRSLSAAERWVRVGLGVVSVVAIAGWSAAAYLYLIAMPDVATAHKVAYTLELVDRFGDSPAHQVYMELADEMKPWWESIDDIQRQIAAASDDDTREKLIAARDATLVTFIREHYLTNRIDMLIASFSPFKRCLEVDACDEDALRKSISIDVKRIYRTFRPYIDSVRSSGKPGTDAFGRDLEDLFFEFVG